MHNAFLLKGYKQDKAFIVAQSPIQNTVRDFWKVIHDRQCASIVMLCEIMEDGRVSYSVHLLLYWSLINLFQEACAAYWPESGAFTYGDMTVTIVSAVEAKEFTTRVFKVTDNVRSMYSYIVQ